MLKSLVVWLTYRCNFTCPYCVEWTRKVKTEPDPKKWINAFNALPPATIDLTGGEPFMHPGIYQILNGIKEEHVVGVTTNLYFVDVLRLPNREKLSLTISLHPSQFGKFSLKMFMKKASILRGKFKEVTVNYVAYHEQIRAIPRYHRYFTSRGFRFHVDPDVNYVYNSKEAKFIAPYLSDDRVVGRGDFITGPKLCDAGMHHAHILPDGTVFRCYYNREVLGNLFTKFQLYSNPEVCNISCGTGCDLDKVKIISLKENE